MGNNICRMFSVAAMLLGFMAISIRAQVSSGRSYTMIQTVIANGGGTSNDLVNNIYKVEGTSGQPTAGTQSTGGSYSIRPGFWAPNPLAVTAASVNIGGRVLNYDGNGISRIRVTATGENGLILILLC